MFVIKDRAISPHKARYQAALKRLPAARVAAQSVAMTHLHERVSQAAEEAGLDSSPLQVGWHKGRLHLGIEYSPAGDRLFDHEFGTPEQAPNPVLRTSVTAHLPVANAHYGHTLRSRLGI